MHAHVSVRGVPFETYLARSLPCASAACEAVAEDLAALRREWICEHDALGHEVNERTPVLVNEQTPLSAAVSAREEALDIDDDELGNGECGSDELCYGALGNGDGATTVYRLVNSEGDGLSGVCVDVYENSAEESGKVAVAAVSAAGLVETLQGPGPLTVCTPLNDAFAALPAGTVETLLKPEKKAILQTSFCTMQMIAI